MRTFSEEYGYKPTRNQLQIKCMDEPLRRALWNVYFRFCVGEAEHEQFYGQFYCANLNGLDEMLWTELFDGTLDGVPHPSAMFDRVRDWFFNAAWFEVFDLVLLVSRHDAIAIDQDFKNECNRVLEELNSAYRFIGDIIAPITDDIEIKEIEEAMDVSPVSGAREHIKTALRLYADRKNPDYRNSIKESISAVEGLCKAIDGSKRPTFKATLKAVGDKLGLHSALQTGLSNIYGYSSDAGGIRHGSPQHANVCSEDARYMLVSCSAFVNYLTEKAEKAGVKL